MISELDYLDCGKFLGCEAAVVKAVKDVEAPMGGLDENGRVVMLFEPHIFWRELRKRGFSVDKLELLRKNNARILSPVWNVKLYAPLQRKANKAIDWVATMDERYEILEQAKNIDENIALKSCSWGAFQIMGFNFDAAGFDSVFDMVRVFGLGERFQLLAFAEYVKANYLDDELRAKDWAGFARGYNGPQYYKNKYDVLLEKAYLKHKK
jgi:hypothetical protein